VLLFVIAFSAVSLNLRREVFLPLLSAVTTVSPGVLDKRERTPMHEPVEPKLTYSEILPVAIKEAKRLGWQEPPGRIGYFMNLGVYAVDFYYPDADHGVAGGGHRRLLYDAQSGALLGNRIPWTGTAGDIVFQAQFPMHSGRILGVGGRILISLMGVVVALLSMTGIISGGKSASQEICIVLHSVFNDASLVGNNFSTSGGFASVCTNSLCCSSVLLLCFS